MIVIHNFRTGFFRDKHSKARTGRSGGGFPPRRAGLLGTTGVVEAPPGPPAPAGVPPATATAFVEPMVSCAAVTLAVPLGCVAG